MSKYSPDLPESGLLGTGSNVTRITDNLTSVPSNNDIDSAQELLSEAIQARQLRYRHFPGKLFGEPAWDMLLELLRAEVANQKVTTSELCETTGVVGPVAMRWIKVLESEGLVLRRADPQDSNRELIQLNPITRSAFGRYFEELSNAH